MSAGKERDILVEWAVFFFPFFLSQTFYYTARVWHLTVSYTSPPTIRIRIYGIAGATSDSFCYTRLYHNVPWKKKKNKSKLNVPYDVPKTIPCSLLWLPLLDLVKLWWLFTCLQTKRTEVMCKIYNTTSSAFYFVREGCECTLSSQTKPYFV